MLLAQSDYRIEAAMIVWESATAEVITYFLSKLFINHYKKYTKEMVIILDAAK